MKKADDDRLRGIFLEIKTDEPSSEFENRLMQRIQVVAAKNEKKRLLLNKIYNICALIAGVSAIIGLPFMLFYLTNISIEYTLKMPKIKVDPIWILLSFSILMLLIADMFIRKHLKNKNHKPL